MTQDKQNYKIKHIVKYEEDYFFVIIGFILLSIIILCFVTIQFLVLKSIFYINEIYNYMLCISLFWIMMFITLKNNPLKPIKFEKVIHKIIDIPKKENKK